MVATDDGTREIRPRRLSWQEQDKFLLSGVDRNSHVQRVLLRFKTTADAERAGKTIRDAFPLVLEHHPAQKEDIEVMASFLISTKAAMPFFFIIIIWGLFALIPFLLAEATILGVVLSGLFVLAMSAFVWLVLARSRRPVKKLLRFVEDSVMLVDGNGEQELVPENFAWKTSESFVLGQKIFRTKVLFTFTSSSEAARAVQMIRERFPTLEQTNIR